MASHKLYVSKIDTGAVPELVIGLTENISNENKKGEKMKTEDLPEESAQRTQDLWKRLAGSKITSLLISALIRVPGLDVSTEVLSKKQNELYASHKNISDFLTIKYNATPAMRSQIEQLVSMVLSDAWIYRNGELGQQEVTKLTNVIADSVKLATPTPKNVFDQSFPRVTAEILAELQASASSISILTRVSDKNDAVKKLFMGSEAIPDAMEKVKGFLRDTAQEITESIMPDNSLEKDKSITYMSTLNCVGQMFTASINSSYEERLHLLQSKKSTPEGKKELYGYIKAADENSPSQLMPICDKAINTTRLSINLQYPAYADLQRTELESQEEGCSPR